MFDLCVCSDTNGSIRSKPDPTQPCKIIIFTIHLAGRANNQALPEQFQRPSYQ